MLCWTGLFPHAGDFVIVCFSVFLPFFLLPSYPPPSLGPFLPFFPLLFNICLWLIQYSSFSLCLHKTFRTWSCGNFLLDLFFLFRFPGKYFHVTVIEMEKLDNPQHQQMTLYFYKFSQKVRD